MRWIHNAERWFRADRWVDAFFAYCEGGLQAFRRVLNELATFCPRFRPAKRKRFLPTLDMLESREVPNAAPLAVADGYALHQGQSLFVPAAGVIGNDSDPDNDWLTANLVSGASNGSLMLGSDGSVWYYPYSRYVGSDSFTYKVNDGEADSNVATVNLIVANAAPTANNDSYSVHQGQSLWVPASGVLGNDSDPDNDWLNAILVSGTSNGSLMLGGDGSVWYYPNSGYVGPDSFIYKVDDGAAESNVATVNINVTNTTPTANNDSYSVHQGQSLWVPAAGVIGNDSDPDNDWLNAILVSGTSNGSLMLGGDGSVWYYPNIGYVGSDSFTYKVNDGAADSNVATVNINVTNATPTANNDSYSVHQGQSLWVPASGVLGNDSDPDNDWLNAILVSGTSNGSLMLGGDGSVWYYPNSGYVGSDSFTYKVNDGAADSNVATVNINVTNATPTASNDSYSVPHGQSLWVPASGVLGNDSDPDNDWLTASLVSGTTNGSLMLGGDGSVWYYPNSGFAGVDSFTYQAFDGASYSNTATVTINVTNTAPTAADDGYSVHHGQTLYVSAAGVLGNDSDADFDPLTAFQITGTSNGTVSLSSDGSFMYTPNVGYVGSDSFTYQAYDGAAYSNTATVNITVTNTAPTAADDGYSVHHGQTLYVSVAGVLGNDSDADFDPLTAFQITGTSNGTVSLSSNGSFTYTPNAGYVGSDSFTYQAYDGAAYSNTATVTITVTNAPPVAVDDAYSTQQGHVLNVPTSGVLGNDSDPDSDPLTSLLVTSASHGTVSLSGDGSFTYTPNPGYVGLDSFTYRDFDGAEYSNVATVTINVTPITLQTQGNAFAALRTISSTIEVGSFTPEPGTSWTDYQAIINWGDGQQSSGSINPSFVVSGAHIYNAANVFAVAFQVININTQTTGVGLSYGQIESLTDDPRFQVVGSFNLTQSRTTSQSGTTGGTYNLTETGTLGYTLAKSIFQQYGSIDSTETDTVSFILQASGDDTPTSFTLGDYTISAAGSAAISFTEFFNNLSLYVSSTGSLADTYSITASGNGVSANFSQSLATSGSLNTTGAGNEGIGSFTTSSAETHTSSRLAPGNYLNTIFITQNESSNATTATSGTMAGGSFTQMQTSSASAALSETEHYPTNAYNLSQSGTNSWTQSKAVTTAAGGSTTTGAGSDSFNLTATNTPSFQSAISQSGNATMATTGNALTESFSSTSSSSYSSSGTLAAPTPPSYVATSTNSSSATETFSSTNQTLSNNRSLSTSSTTSTSESGNVVSGDVSLSSSVATSSNTSNASLNQTQSETSTASATQTSTNSNTWNVFMGTYTANNTVTAVSTFTNTLFDQTITDIRNTGTSSTRSSSRSGNNIAGDYTAATSEAISSNATRTYANQTELVISATTSTNNVTSTGNGNTVLGTYSDSINDAAASAATSTYTNQTATRTSTASSTGNTSKTSSGNVISGAYSDSTTDTTSSNTTNTYTNQTASETSSTASSSTRSGTRTGNSVLGAFTDSSSSSISFTTSTAYANQTESRNSLTNSSNMNTSTNTGNSITGVYTGSCSDTISISTSSTYSNQTESRTSTMTSASASTNTSTGNSVTGIYAGASSESRSATTTSAYANQTATETSSTFSTGTRNAASSGNTVTGDYADNSNDTSNSTTTSAYANQTASRTSTTTATISLSRTSTGNATTGINTQSTSSTGSSTTSAAYANQTETKTSMTNSTNTATGASSGNSVTGTYSDTNSNIISAATSSTHANQTVLVTGLNTSTSTLNSTSSGNKTTGVYSDSSSATISNTSTSTYTNQTETRNDVTSSAETSTNTSSGNSIIGTYANSSNNTVSATTSSTNVNQTANRTTTVISSANSTNTSSGNAILGAYSDSSSNTSSSSTSSSYTNKTATESTSTTSTGTGTNTRSGNAVTGLYSDSNNSTISITTSSAYTNQTESRNTSTTSADALTSSRSGNAITGTYTSTSSDSSTGANTSSYANQGISIANSTTFSNTSTGSGSGNDETGAFATSGTFTSSRTVSTSGTNARGTFTSSETINETGTRTNSGNRITGVDSPSSSSTITRTGTKSGGNALTSYSQNYSDNSTETVSYSSDNTVTGAFANTVTTTTNNDLLETGSYQSTTYSIDETDVTTSVSTSSGNWMSGLDNNTTTTSFNSIIDETASDSGGGGYVLAKTINSSSTETSASNAVTGVYSSADSSTSTTVANETTNNPAGTSTFTETIADAGSTNESGDVITGLYSMTLNRTRTMSDVDSGTLAAGSFSVIESSNEIASGTKSGNYVTGAYSLIESITNNYSMSEDGPDFTLEVTGDWTGAVNNSGNAILGTYTNSTVGHDEYSMTESGTISGSSFSETLVGDEDFTFTESGNTENQTFSREIIGVGSYTDTLNGTPTSGSYSYGLQEGASARAGVFSQSGGLGRYNILQRFIDVSNTTAGNTPGHMNFLPFGQPFVDPDPKADKTEKKFSRPTFREKEDDNRESAVITIIVNVVPVDKNWEVTMDYKIQLTFDEKAKNADATKKRYNMAAQAFGIQHGKDSHSGFLPIEKGKVVEKADDITKIDGLGLKEPIKLGTIPIGDKAEKKFVVYGTGQGVKTLEDVLKLMKTLPGPGNVPPAKTALKRGEGSQQVQQRIEITVSVDKDQVKSMQIKIDPLYGGSADGENFLWPFKELDKEGKGGYKKP